MNTGQESALSKRESQPINCLINCYAALLCIGTTAITPGAYAQDMPFVHPLFSSDMVLQRDVAVPVWGWTTPGATVTVTVSDDSKQAVAGSDGRWEVQLTALSAGGPHTLAISGPQSVTFTNVMSGDVWLCAGQSNMERQLTAANVLNGAAEAADSINFPNIRQLKISTATARTPQLSLPSGNAAWKVANPTNIGGFSAVGYFMARALYQEYNVPMGILNISWGGTRHAPWMSPAAAASIADLSQEVYDLPTLETLDPITTPCVNYNAMMAPVIGFPVRGIVWYQGESSSSLADQYQLALPTLLNDWRATFGNTSLPVVIVQVSNYANAITVPVQVFATWPIIREAQLVAAQTLGNAGVVCTIDAGDSASPADIHPKNKQDVGKRAARVMRQLAYGAPETGQSPLFTHAVVENGNSIRCHFSNVGEGLMVGSKAANSTDPVQPAAGGTLFGFALTAKANAIAEADWKYATAEIDAATNTVVVTSAAVPAPVHVRYAWGTNPHNYAQGQVCNLYSKITDGLGTVVDGLPASPFRSDPKVWLKVNVGTGSTTVTTPKVPGSSVAISASTAPAGQQFAGWAGQITALANPASASTTATLTSAYTSVRALYRFTDPPQNLAGGIFGTEAAISWTAVSGARYSIYRSENGGPLIVLASGLLSNMFTDHNINSGSLYSYSVTSDRLGTSSPLADSIAAAPFQVASFDLTSGTATVNFPSVLGKTYRVERSTNLTTWTVIHNSIAGTGFDIQIQDVPTGNVFFYRATAY